jgi:hypothetical protein
MQTPMLIATEILAFRRDALAPGQMHPAVNAAHHIFAFKRGWTFLFLLPFFKRAPDAAYQPQEEHGNKDKEQDSTHWAASLAASRRDTRSV